MDALPEFEVLRPTSLDDVMKARAAHADSRMLGGGTDLVVNIRRGIVAPPVLIDMNRVAELRAIKADAQSLEIGASVTLAELAEHPDVVAHYPVVAQAAAHIAGPTHRHMGTVGGNLCLDTRCIYYNQSEWWRVGQPPLPQDHRRHLSRGAEEPRRLLCDLQRRPRAGAAHARRRGRSRRAAGQAHRAAREPLYRPCAAGPAGDRDHGRRQILSRAAAGRVRRPRCARTNTPGLRSGYDKLRIRRSIEYPVAGVAVALRRDGDTLADLRVAFTGTNPRPVLLEGTAALCGGPLDERVFKGLDALVRDQIMAMKTTFTPGHYRRRVASRAGAPAGGAPVRAIALVRGSVVSPLVPAQAGTQITRTECAALGSRLRGNERG